MSGWRLIDAGAREAPEMFGRMPAVAAGVAQGGAQVLQTGMFGRGHFQIGWFEDVDAVIDLDEARRRGVQVFRRPVWGGGTAFYDTNASALFSFFIHDSAFASLDEALEHFRPVMSAALEGVGLGAARFEGSSDIRFEGRKLGTLITQSVLGTKVVGGFLNLRRPDLELYAAVAHVPEEKFKDKAIKDAVAYICTPADVRGTDLGYAELREALVRAAREIAGLDFEPTPFTPEEDRIAGDFAATVSADDWVRRVSTGRFRNEAAPGARTGFANLKAKKLIRCGVELDAGGALVRVMVAGDMHVSPPDAMDRIAAALAGADPADREDLVGRVRAVLAQPDVDQADAAAGITAEDVVDCVLLAVKGVSG